MSENTTAEINWKEESQRFDGVADLYDTYRPSYPNELVESIISKSGLQPGDRILEIGSGTGKATALFAPRGFSILCLEPGKNLMNVAAEKLKWYEQVKFEQARFEQWQPSQIGFKVAMSAQAFHWVPKDVGYGKAASVLANEGYIALFWNMYPKITGEVAHDLQRVYQECVPELMKRSASWEELIKQREREFIESGYYEGVQVERYPWTARYTSQEYLGLLW